MKNFIQPGEMIEHVLSGTSVLSGAGRLIGTLFGVASKDGAIGDVVNFALAGVYSLPKLTTDVMAQGAKVYWDDTNKRLTVTAAGNSLVGVAHKAAGNGDTVVDCRLNGISI